MRRRDIYEAGRIPACTSVEDHDASRSEIDLDGDAGPEPRGDIFGLGQHRPHPIYRAAIWISRSIRSSFMAFSPLMVGIFMRKHILAQWDLSRKSLLA